MGHVAKIIKISRSSVTRKH